MDNETENEDILRLRITPFNAHLTGARKKLSFTQRQVHLMTGIPSVKISQIETLRCIATDDEKAEIASALGKSVEFLFPEELEEAINVGVFKERTKQGNHRT